MRWQLIGQYLFFATVSIVFASDTAWASEISEWLWGGRGAQTTVSNLYVPPPLATEATVAPIDSPGLATMQSNLMLGTPGAMTLPPGDVIATNGVASIGVSSTGYVVPTQFTTVSNAIPTIPMLPQQPVLDYEWTYSTIKDVSYEQVTVYDPRVGGYVTTWQEKRTESVLPWLHRKQVVRYQSPTSGDVIGGTTIGSTSTPSVSPPSERRIVNRLFPVSTVPSPPAQSFPVQAYPMQTAPMAVESAGHGLQASDFRVEYRTPIQESEVLSRNDVIVSDLPIFPAVTIPLISQPATQTASAVGQGPFILAPQEYSTEYSATISSQHADEPPTLPSVVSPSAHQMLYPVAPANITTTFEGSPKPAAKEPTLAPQQSEQKNTESGHSASQTPNFAPGVSAVALPPGSTLPPPVQSSPIPSLETPVRNETPSPNTTESGIPYLQPSGGTQPTMPSPSQPVSSPPSGSRPGMSVSPIRRSPMYN